uniref:Uncharacterized protein n=1 Tax=Arundo donax TaxID=35708 RepID=A0A0A9HCI0_ARUDO
MTNSDFIYHLRELMEVKLSRRGTSGAFDELSGMTKDFLTVLFQRRVHQFLRSNLELSISLDVAKLFPH